MTSVKWIALIAFSVLLGCSSIESAPEYVQLSSEIAELKAKRGQLEREITQLSEELLELDDQRAFEIDIALGDEAALQEALALAEGRFEDEARVLSQRLTDETIRAQILNDRVVPACEKFSEQIYYARAVTDSDVEEQEIARSKLSDYDVYWLEFFSPETSPYAGLQALKQDAAEQKNDCAQAGYALAMEACESIDRLLLKKDPSDYFGQCVKGRARIAQLDSNTGPCTFHGYLDGESDVRVQFGMTLDPDRHLSETDCDFFDLLKEDMKIRFWGYGIGISRYETTIGGSQSIPAIKLLTWGYG